MERSRAWRRAQASRKQSNRLRKYLETGFWKPEWVQESWIGQLRKNHFGCGCTMCKPWKHNCFGESPLRVSEQRKIQDEEESAAAD